MMAQMDSQEVKLLLEIEMIVDNNAFVILCRDEREQTLTIDGFASRLADMKNIKPFLEEGGKDFVLLNKEIRI